MKNLIFFSILFHCFHFFSQEWQTISKANSYKHTPYEQFIIDPYSNSMWFVQYLFTTMIQSDGLVNEFGENELGNLNTPNIIMFAFSPNNTYLYNEFEGVFNFNNFQRTLIIADSDGEILTNNLDTLYLTKSSSPFLKIVNNQNINSSHNAAKIVSKGDQFYRAGNTNSSLVKDIGPNNGDYLYYSQIDDEYICPQFWDIKFSRLTDTLYVACKKGISFAYNYDFLDTITPNNTINMPSSNVLEIEFDHLDRLWAVFGDDNDKAFSIAMLENDTWINYYDVNNSPIQFDAVFDVNYFLEMEIDNLGNVWVCDRFNLHTLSSSTTPAWVGLKSVEKESFEISPNPALDILKVNFNNPNELKKIQLIDLNGQVLIEKMSTSHSEQISVEKLKSGVYIVSVSENNHVAFKKIVKL